jgi:hypothetical protein
MHFAYLGAVLTIAAFAQPAAPTFVPAGFDVPRLHKSSGYQLVPLGPELARHDYEAYMSSIEHLQQTFSMSTRWPHANLTMAEAMKDVEGEKARFEARRSFTYAVLTPDGAKELGCVYVSPSRKQGYDAVVRVWVTKAQYDAGLEKTLIPEVKAWLAERWPFTRVAWVGREVTREAFAALPDRE